MESEAINNDAIGGYDGKITDSEQSEKTNIITVNCYVMPNYLIISSTLVHLISKARFNFNGTKKNLYFMLSVGTISKKNKS